MMFGILFIAASVLLSINAQADSNDPINCINDLIKWCDNKNYGNIGQENSLSSSSDNGSQQVIRCTSNSHGTICSKNGSQWIKCSTGHTVTYKGSALMKNSRTGADYEICDASKFVNNDSENASKSKEIFKDCFPFCDSNPFA